MACCKQARGHHHHHQQPFSIERPWPRNDSAGRKASTVATWSNLPGKELLFDQLAKLKASAKKTRAREKENKMESLLPSLSVLLNGINGLKIQTLKAAEENGKTLH